MTTEELALALAIFGLRVLNYSVGTIRLLVVARGQRVLGSSMAALEAFIFAVVIAKIITGLDNIPNLVAYCAGASVGSYVGMMLEARFVRSFMIVNVIISERAHKAAETLRDAGFGVTATLGEGKDGVVTTLRSIVNKRDVTRFLNALQEVAPEAFIALEEVRGIRRGWLSHNHRKS